MPALCPACGHRPAAPRLCGPCALAAEIARSGHPPVSTEEIARTVEAVRRFLGQQPHD